ncbi:helix-turn-helix domain-containing protein [Sagittula salina]|uniref:Helix-turn-helix transcriptional regulator n=1 Tax=Sagittula salina TaxID=2820268 RepID=A0A940MRT4_9RHOB|nr:helix-turn-helix transcriptional regulator [Sagittula salina]MBP0484650.1 helix-turn-helix transcriptional regulator [Sagittula salina]
MTIAEYVAFRKDMGDTQAKIADDLAIADCYLSQILNGVRTPGSDVMRRISMATGGVVDMNSWLRHGIHDGETQ